MGGYLLLFPKARVDILLFFVIIIRIIPVPAWFMLAIWFGLQLFGGFNAVADQGGVAYWAHAGGFIAGIALTLPLWLRRGGPAYWSRTDGHPPHPEATYRRTRTRVPPVRRR
jgi:membrane associated rhomboid family serine protease